MASPLINHCHCHVAHPKPYHKQLATHFVKELVFVMKAKICEIHVNRTTHWKYSDQNQNYSFCGSSCCSRFCIIYFNTLRPRQDDHHFPDDILKSIFLNEIVWISFTISLKCVQKVRIINIPSYVQIMAGHRAGDKPLSELITVSLLTHICVTRSQWVKQFCIQVAPNISWLSGKTHSFSGNVQSDAISVPSNDGILWDKIPIKSLSQDSTGRMHSQCVIVGTLTSIMYHKRCRSCNCFPAW